MPPRGNNAFIQLLSHAIYDALEPEFKQIRLIRLEPQSTAVAEIRCRLLTVSLENPPAYQALSYVWGDSRNRQIIYIDGICLPVTLNLAAALQRLRHPHEEVVLWIDAICIDQSNLSERSSQVKMMGEIYRAAQRVLAWLGEEADGSRAAFAFMKNDLVHRWNPKNTASRAFSDTRESLLALFGRPYWWRVWTQQEMALSRQLIFLCGADEISLERLEEFKGQWNDKVEVNPLTMPDVHELDSELSLTISSAGIGLFFRRVIQERRSLNLEYLIDKGRLCKATDPRDMLYGMISGYEGGNSLIEPDYTLSTAKVYANFIRSGLLNTGRLMLDGSNGIGKDFYFEPQLPVPNLPTWVPDYTARPKRTTSPTESGLLDHHSGAAGATMARAFISEEGNILRAAGLVVDEIEDFRVNTYPTLDGSSFCGMVFPERERPQPGGMPTAQAFFRSLAFLTHRSDTIDPGSFRFRHYSDMAHGFLLHTIGKSLVRDPRFHPKFHELVNLFVSFGTPEEEIDRALRRHGLHIYLFLGVSGAVNHMMEARRNVGLAGIAHFTPEDFLEGLYGATASRYRLNLKTLEWREPDNTRASNRYSTILRVGFHDSLFVTPAGYIGRGPPGVQRGDRLCVLLGCRTPLIIRNFGGYYRVVGSCFVPALMDGEAVGSSVAPSELEQLVDIEFH